MHPLIEVEAVSIEKDFNFVVTFTNGQKKKVDFSRFLKNPPPVFKALQDKNEVKKLLLIPWVEFSRIVVLTEVLVFFFLPKVQSKSFPGLMIP